MTNQLLKASLRAYDPRRLIVPLDPDTDRERINRLGYSAQRQPYAYICVGRSCLEPTTTRGQISQQLSEMVNAKWGPVD
jgi:uncharacterized protein YyaL (SSP411 family)